MVERRQTNRYRVAIFPNWLEWKQAAGRIYDKLFEDEVFGRSAQLAYYWLFSLFPLLIFLTTLLAFLPMSEDLDAWLTALANVLPANAFDLVQNTFHEITQKQRHGLLSFSVLILLWSSSSGMGAIITSLNKAFGARESRAWWWERLLAVLLTIGLTIFIISALMLIFFGDTISNQIAEAYGLGRGFKALWKLAQWPLVIVFVLVGVELIYYFAPNIRQRWAIFTPGTLFALLFWLLISFGLRLYVSHFANYTATYGALGGVMVLMIWLYLMGVGILTGGVINSVMRSDLKENAGRDR